MSESPLSFRYQQELAPLTQLARDSNRSELGKRLSELLALLDFSTTLNRSLALTEILDLVLFFAMGETRATWAAVALKGDDGRLRPASKRGPAGSAWSREAFSAEGAGDLETVVGRNDPGLAPSTHQLITAMGAHLMVPLRKGGDLIGVLALGRPASTPSGGAPDEYSRGERSFAEALSISAAACIDNGRIYEEMRQLNRRLSLKVYQLNSLFDITRELHRPMDEARVREVLVASAMGQLLATRCVLIQPGGAVEVRGAKLSPAEREVLRTRARLLGSQEETKRVRTLEEGALRELLEAKGFEWAVPLRTGSSFHGMLFIGAKADGKPLGEEDVDFLRSLSAQGAGALDNLRLTREWMDKQKIEKELALAREIQRGLLPEDVPSIPGWDIAGINIPSLTVGGDYYDYLPGPDGRLGLAIADVSGKGTGPALLMASVQASLKALSCLGPLTLDVMLSRLNEHIFSATETNRYVTVFFGWLDPGKAELTYSNAGHCYPLLFRRGGDVERLAAGGTVIGMFPEIRLEAGRTSIGRGDMLVLYTDGLSETQSPSGVEFQEERIIETARAVAAAPAREVVAKLVSAARIFAAEAGLGDDLTLMVVKRS